MLSWCSGLNRCVYKQQVECKQFRPTWPLIAVLVTKILANIGSFLTALLWFYLCFFVQKYPYKQSYGDLTSTNMSNNEFSNNRLLSLNQLVKLVLSLLYTSSNNEFITDKLIKILCISCYC